MEKKKVSGVMLVLLIASMLALAWNGQSARASLRILVINHEETRFWYMDYALDQLGISHSSIRISEVGTVALSNYDIVLVGSFIGLLNEVKPSLDVWTSEIEAWIIAGGSLGVFCQFVGAIGYDLNDHYGSVYGSGYYEWMPENPSFVSVGSHDAHITNQAHLITQGLTDSDLSGWYTSPDGYFSSFPGEGLIVQAGYPDRVALFAQTLGSGKIVGSSIDVDYHFWFNARGQEGINDAKMFLQNIINWLTPSPPATVEASLTINPGTLNLKSEGQWITAYVQLPEGYTAADIDATTILLNDTVPPVLDPKYSFVTNSSECLVDCNNDGVLERMVKFDRPTVESLIYNQGIRYGDVALTLAGKLFDGTSFGETAVIFVNYAGDMNNDGKIDVLDAAAESAHWYPGPPTGPLGYDSNADFDNDGTVNILDSGVVSSNWGETVP